MPIHDEVITRILDIGAVKLCTLGKVLRGKNPKKYSLSGIPIIRATDLNELTEKIKLLEIQEDEENNESGKSDSIPK